MNEERDRADEPELVIQTVILEDIQIQITDRIRKGETYKDSLIRLGVLKISIEEATDPPPKPKDAPS